MADNNARNRSAWTRSVAAQIRAERAARGLTQRDVIDQSGIPKSTYLRLESGERVADMEQLALFAEAMGVPVSVILRRAEDRLAEQPLENADPIRAEIESGLGRAGKRALRDVEGDVADPSPARRRPGRTTRETGAAEAADEERGRAAG